MVEKRCEKWYTVSRIDHQENNMHLKYQAFEQKLLIPILLFAMAALAFFIDEPMTIWGGLGRIYTVPGLLVTDFLSPEIGGLGATLMNVAIILAFNFILIKILKIKFSGPVVAGLFTIAGFAFFGKTLLNTAPIYLGIYLYSLYSKTPFKNFIIVALFATGIGPIVSFVMFGINLAFYISIPLGIVAGIFTGFFIQIIATNAMKFHMGYNLYNVGFTLGLLAMLYTGFFKIIGVNLNTGVVINNNHHSILFVIVLFISVFSIASAFLNDPRVLQKYPGLLKMSGRLVSDFIRETSQPVVLLNIGLLGLLCLGIGYVFAIPVNGPIFGGMMTVMGFGAFGKHLKNSIAVMTGTVVASFLFKLDMQNSIGVGLGVFFVTALAPVAGRFGFFAGVLAGFVHMIVLPMAIVFQGGFDLYNNGFAAGFVAAVLVPVLEVITSKGVEKNVVSRN